MRFWGTLSVLGVAAATLIGLIVWGAVASYRADRAQCLAWGESWHWIGFPVGQCQWRPDLDHHA